MPAADVVSLFPVAEVHSATRTFTRARSHPLPSRAAAARHHEQFARDATDKLIERLRHNVIRTGLRRIELAYSRIQLKVREKG